MNEFRKLIIRFLVLLGIALFIYIFNFIWMPLMKSTIRGDTYFMGRINYLVQIASIALPTVISIVKFKLKAPILSLVFLYLFCLLYEIQGYFLLINTSPYWFLTFAADCSKEESALWIVAQCGIVMLLTTVITYIVLGIKHKIQKSHNISQIEK